MRLILILTLFLLSCGARKRSLSENEKVEKVKNDIQIDSSFIKTMNINLSDKTKEIIFEPVVLDYPMRVNQDTLYNTRVIYKDKVRDSIVYVKELGNVSKIDKSEKSAEEKSKNVETERESFNWKGLNWSLILLIIILCLVIALRYLSKRLSKK